MRQRKREREKGQERKRTEEEGVEEGVRETRVSKLRDERKVQCKNKKTMEESEEKGGGTAEDAEPLSGRLGLNSLSCV